MRVCALGLGAPVGGAGLDSERARMVTREIKSPIEHRFISVYAMHEEGLVERAFW